jgi:polyisoprenoid-binding protein YceI
MKIRFILLIFAAAVAFTSCDKSAPASAKSGEAGTEAKAAATAKTFTVDPAATKLAWIGSKITGDQHNGTINVSNGTMKLEGDKLTAGEFTIDMTSIKNLDIPAEEEGNGKLIGHLKSPDFFGVEAHPTASFVITGVEAVEGEGPITHNIKGNLTIKGITKEITIPTAVTMGGGSMNAEASFSFDRAQFDVRYGSSSFFEDLGDKIINDEIKMELVLVANADAV